MKNPRTGFLRSALTRVKQLKELEKEFALVEWELELLALYDAAKARSRKKKRVATP